MERTLEGKVALVTGGGAGIGKATALVLAHRGARVVIGNRDAAAGERVVQAIRSAGGEATFRRTDLTGVGEPSALVEHAVRAYGRLDIAFNNAGTAGPIGPLADQEGDAFDQVFGLDVRAVFLCMKHEIRQMLVQGGGAIVNNISTNGFRNFMPGQSLYTAAKHALVGLTKAAAAEYAAKGVRINAVAPGPTRTEEFRRVVAGDEATVATRLPLGRVGQPEEIGEAVAWLCSDAAAYVVGHTLVADGGFLASD